MQQKKALDLGTQMYFQILVHLYLDVKHVVAVSPIGDLRSRP